VARWPWRTGSPCQQADRIRFSITELVIDFFAPDGRAENLRINRGAEWANAYVAPDRYLDNSLLAPDHHSKRAAPKHQLTTKTDPGGVARHPDDVALDRKIGCICRRMLVTAAWTRLCEEADSALGEKTPCQRKPVTSLALCQSREKRERATH